MTSGINGHDRHQFEPELTEIYRQHITASAYALGEDWPATDEIEIGRPRPRSDLNLNWDPHAR